MNIHHSTNNGPQTFSEYGYLVEQWHLYMVTTGTAAAEAVKVLEQKSEQESPSNAIEQPSVSVHAFQ